jgi:hypothetical protein
MPPVGFEPAIPATKQPQTYALDRAVTGIGTFSSSDLKLVTERPNRDRRCVCCFHWLKSDRIRRLIEVGEEGGTRGRNERSDKLKRRSHLGDQAVDGIIL